MAPKMAAPVMMATLLQTEKMRSLNMRGGNSGSSARNCCATNSAISTMPAAVRPTIGRDVQAYSVPPQLDTRRRQLTPATMRAEPR